MDDDRADVDWPVCAGRAGSRWPRSTGTRRAWGGASRSAGPGPRTRRTAADPWSARRRPAAGRRPVFVEELLQGPGELARQALLPLQRLARAVFGVGLGSHRSQAAAVGVLGRLQ